MGPERLATIALGAVLGMMGFAPLLGVVVFAHRGGIRPTVAKGLAAVAVSFAFLMAVLAAVWLLVPARTLEVLAGMLIGFFAMWAFLACMAMGRRF